MTDSPNNLTLEQFRQSWPARGWCDVTTLVGVSGGADSVALLRLMQNLRAESSGSGRLIVAHFDHAWRDDSRQDAAFVVELARSLDLPCVTGSAAEEAGTAENAARSEERARTLRYAFLTRTAKQRGARWIAVAHTGDDQVETILHHVIRGSGLRGLGGMRRLRSIDESLSLIRPLLGFPRSQLIDYLRAIGQAFRVDPTNADPSFTRARIRHELLPQLRTYNAEVDQSLMRLGRLAAEACGEISREARQVLRDATTASTATSVEISMSALASVSPYIVREMFMELWRDRSWPLQGMSYEKWDSLSRLVHGDGPPTAMTLNLPGNVLVRCEPTMRMELSRELV